MKIGWEFVTASDPARSFTQRHRGNRKMKGLPGIGSELATPSLFRYTRGMAARVAEEAAIESVRKLSPEERLTAFLTHCELMALLSRTRRVDPRGKGCQEKL